MDCWWTGSNRLTAVETGNWRWHMAPNFHFGYWHGRPQAWARGGGSFAPLWKCCKMFCASAVTVKRAADQLFMHYFHNFSSGFQKLRAVDRQTDRIDWYIITPHSRMVIILNVARFLCNSSATCSYHWNRPMVGWLTVHTIIAIVLLHWTR